MQKLQHLLPWRWRWRDDARPRRGQSILQSSVSQSPPSRSKFPNPLRLVRALLAQARANKASWQVWNFFLLQAGMVLGESIYALATRSAGLILVSADNIFCCIALALGLQAVSATASAPTDVYRYGLSRYESLAGFTNGLLLVYVAVLVVLESVERHLDASPMEYAHTSVVCVVGILGNLGGLVFFPPESRRENHNVQAIYLHIWGNTLAFVGVGASTLFAQFAPGRFWADVGSAVLVATIVILSAVPLIARSARVLLLAPGKEKRKELETLQTRIKQIDGVESVTALRTWHLTPTCMVGSVKVSVKPMSATEEDDILFKVRSLFATVGISTSQATIQVASSNISVRGAHKRVNLETVVDTPELEGLYIPREARDLRQE